MKLTLHTFLTLDGVMQGPGDAEEDTSGGFDRGGWLVPYVDEAFGEIVDGWFAPAEALLFGRTTYDLMRAYWPEVDDPDNAVAEKLNGLPKYVASRSLRDPDWHPTTVLDGDAVTAVTDLKARPGGELQVHGSWGLAQALHAAGLIDEYRLLVFPVSVGAGKRLFSDGAPASGYRVAESRTTGAGVTYLALQPTPFVTGSHRVVDGKDTTELT